MDNEQVRDAIAVLKDFTKGYTFLDDDGLRNDKRFRNAIAVLKAFANRELLLDENLRNDLKHAIANLCSQGL